MDDFIYISLGLAFIVGLPALIIAAFVMIVGTRARLAAVERELNDIRQQLTRQAARLSASDIPRAEADIGTAASDTIHAETARSEAHTGIPLPSTDMSLAESPVPDAETPIAPAPPPPLPAATAFDHPGEAVASGPPPLPGASMPRPKRSLEESIGTRWTVWVGGLALALGGIFLVKYSIDQGFFSPILRIALAALFSIALIAAGETLRRRERPASTEAPNAAPIPAVLVAAGTVAAFATVYGAYALYHLIGDSTAFILLGLVAVGTMAAALLHGPWIATLGILGAYATPLLITTKTPNLTALVAYLLAVTLSAFGVARIRLWQIVAVWALALALGWGLLIDMAIPGEATEFGVYIIGLTALISGFLVIGLDDALAPPLDRSANWPALIGIAGTATLVLLLLYQNHHQAFSLAVTTLVVIAALGLAWRYPAMVIATAIAGLLTFLGLASWTINLPATLDTGTMVQTFDGIVRIRPNLITEFASVAAGAALLFLGTGGQGALRATPQAEQTSGWFTASAAASPALILIIAWLRIDGWVPSPLFAGLALTLAVTLGILTTRLIAREDAAAPSVAVAIAAIGTITALGVGFTIALEKGALTIALALMVPAIAWVHATRPIAILRPLATLIGAIVLARVLMNPRIVGDDLGTTPIFNWLLYGYGVPTAGFAYAAMSFRRRAGQKAANDPWIGGLEALTIIFAGMLGVFELHHYLHGGRALEPDTDLAELGLMTTMGLVGTLALSRLAGRIGSAIYDGASIVSATLTLLVAVWGLLLFANPGISGELIGDGLIFNDLLPGYLIPALVAGLAAHLTRRSAGDIRANGLAVTTVVLSFTYVTLMTRHIYQGKMIGMLGAFMQIMPHTSDQELWTYSAVWLIYGLVTLGMGGFVRSTMMRMIGAAIIVLTILKVFLIDMSALTGIFRALSFIGLGGVLIGVGFVYQKWFFRGSRKPEAT